MKLFSCEGNTALGVLAWIAAIAIGTWYFSWWPFEERWEGYFYPTSVARVRGLEDANAKLIAGHYSNEHDCYEYLHEIADDREYPNDMYILGCDKTRRFRSF